MWQAALPQGIVPFVFAKEYNVHPAVLSTGKHLLDQEDVDMVNTLDKEKGQKSSLAKGNCK
ncbi:auxin efflux carrier family [Vigna unguiculata]|uniref:Auxin efflux carrier family n=1 Tax=Vigna unguiculata TaxID=3917 RepID=A0A4D6LYN7_VIGUN|nr:auxin efflux carrier family [Vigna unguiculata]